MRILLVTPFSLTATGGVTVTVERVREQLVALGHDATVFVEGASRGFARMGDHRGSAVYGAYLRAPYLPEMRIAGLAAFLMHLVPTVWRLHRFLRHQRIEVVHLFYPLPFAWYFAALRPISRWRLVVTYLGNDVHDLQDAHWSSLLITRRLLAAADEVTGVSQSLIDKLRQLTGARFRGRMVPTGSLLPASSGLDARRLFPDLPETYVMTAGHLIVRKGIDVLLRAQAECVASGRALPLLVVGDGPERTALENMAAGLGITPLVRFLGNQPQEHVVALLRGARLFVLASRAEGLPLVIIEAMSARAPVVATNVDGIPEVIEQGKTGLLVPPEDHGALSAAMQQMLADSEASAAMAEAAYLMVVRTLTWQTVTDRYLELYRS